MKAELFVRRSVLALAFSGLLADRKDLKQDRKAQAKAQRKAQGRKHQNSRMPKGRADYSVRPFFF